MFTKVVVNLDFGFLLQTVEIKVKMDCEGCERKVKHAVSHMRGIVAL